MKIKPLHFLCFWGLLNVIQGSFTELTSDEGYYWFYSTSLEWGYYDHPPFLAWIIRIGYSIFQNELGVRLFSILLNVAAIFLFFKLLSGYLKDISVVYLVILSFPVLNYLSFIVFPDGPLLFFSVGFLLAYKRLLEKNDYWSAIFLGLSIAGMLYSKYHGLLILIFTVISNFKLLRSKYLYVASGIAFILFLPHLLWQYTHDFPTIKYHLSGRMSSFSIKHFFEYLPQQILSIGPALIFIPFIYKTTDQFEKTLKYIILGTFGFFLFSSFKAFVHFHWTSIVIFPLIFLSAKYYSSKKRKALLLWLGLPFIIFILLVRIQLMTPGFPVDSVNVDYYHGRKLWANEIAQLSGGRPVLFAGNYRLSSLYSFYTKQTGVALYSGEKRKSQYEMWDFEDSLQQKDILFIDDHSFKGSKEFDADIGKKLYYITVPAFSSYYNIKMKVIKMQSGGIKDSLHVAIGIINPRKSPLFFQKNNPEDSPLLYYSIKQKEKEIQKDTLMVFTERDMIESGTSRQFNLSIPVHYLKKGLYRMIFGFQFGPLSDSYNAEIRLKIQTP
jgi:4-amino-4-deoxy-L-arabinose transferase-like glycosyltransferase